MLLAITVLSLIGCSAIYLIAGALGYQPEAGLQINRRTRQHLGLLIAALLLIMAWGASLDMPRLLLTPSGVIQGASYVDVEVTLPMLKLLMLVLLLGSGLAAYQAFSIKNWPIPLAMALYFIVSAGGAGYAAVIQRIVVTPNEQEKEAPFITYTVSYTHLTLPTNREV